MLSRSRNHAKNPNIAAKLLELLELCANGTRKLSGLQVKTAQRLLRKLTPPLKSVDAPAASSYKPAALVCYVLIDEAADLKAPRPPLAAGETELELHPALRPGSAARVLTIAVPKVFAPMLGPSRYKAAYGGRGSGKSHFMAGQMVVRALLNSGHRGMCLRGVQKSLSGSAKHLIENKIRAYGLGPADGFVIMSDRIITPGDGVLQFLGMQDSESIKSLENFATAWIEEAQTVSHQGLQDLRPTMRADGSEIWCSWNPRRKTDAVDVLLRSERTPTGTVALLVNWSDNPYFTKALEDERQDAIEINPEQYAHVWDGDYAGLMAGGYYSAQLTKARNDGRIGFFARDPNHPVQLFVDIGGTGARADAFTIWAAQILHGEIRVLNYYEAVGQPLATHVNWMCAEGYGPRDRTHIYLPHDGVQHDKIFGITPERALQDMGFDVTVIKNQGTGAALLRVQAARRMFPSCRFNAEPCAPGLDALGWYHEKQDKVRQVGLGPEHDWSSHGADSFGLLCVVAEEAGKGDKWSGDIDYSKMDGPKNAYWKR